MRGREALRIKLATLGIELTPANVGRQKTRVVLSAEDWTCYAKITTSNGQSTFRLSLSDFVVIVSEPDNRQGVYKQVLKRPEDLHVFVWLGQDKCEPNKFFVLTASELQEVVHVHHQAFLNKCDRTRPQNPDSDDNHLRLEDLAAFEDRWQALTWEKS